jgi:hypothetical protein
VVDSGKVGVAVDGRADRFPRGAQFVFLLVGFPLLVACVLRRVARRAKVPVMEFVTKDFKSFGGESRAAVSTRHFDAGG